MAAFDYSLFIHSFVYLHSSKMNFYPINDHCLRLLSNNKDFTLQVDPDHLLIFDSTTHNNGNKTGTRTNEGNSNGLEIGNIFKAE